MSTIPFSFSQISSCPIKNYFKYYSPFKYQIDTYSLLLGRLTHKLIEHYIRQKFLSDVNNSWREQLDKLINTINDTPSNSFKNTWQLFKELLLDRSESLFSEQTIKLLKNSQTIEELISITKGNVNELEAQIIYNIWLLFKEQSKILARHSLKLYKIAKQFLSLYFSNKSDIKLIQPEYKLNISKLESITSLLNKPIDLPDIIKSVKFTGYIDLVVETNDNKLYIIDWKTGSQNSLYNIQLQTYFIGWMLTNNLTIKDFQNKVVYLKLVYLKDQTETTIELNFKTNFKQTEQTITEWLDNLISLIYKRKLIEFITEPINYDSIISLQDILILKEFVNLTNQNNTLNSNLTRLDKLVIFKNAFQTINQLLTKPIDTKLMQNVINLYYTFDIENSIPDKYCKFCEYNFICPKGIIL